MLSQSAYIPMRLPLSRLVVFESRVLASLVEPKSARPDQYPSTATHSPINPLESAAKAEKDTILAIARLQSVGFDHAFMMNSEGEESSVVWAVALDAAKIAEAPTKVAAKRLSMLGSTTNQNVDNGVAC